MDNCFTQNWYMYMYMYVCSQSHIIFTAITNLIIIQSYVENLLQEWWFAQSVSNYLLSSAAGQGVVIGHTKPLILNIINRIRHLSRATLTSYRPILAVSNIDRSIFACIARSEKSMAKYV